MSNDEVNFDVRYSAFIIRYSIQLLPRRIHQRSHFYAAAELKYRAFVGNCFCGVQAFGFDQEYRTYQLPVCNVWCALD